MKKIIKYSSLAALGLVAAGALAACSGGEKKDAATSEATSPRAASDEYLTIFFMIIPPK